MEVTPDEAALIKKHKWSNDFMAKVEGVDPKIWFKWRTDAMIGSHSFPFDAIEHAADFEQQVIESARTLKRNLEASAGFAATGPREFPSMVAGVRVVRVFRGSPLRLRVLAALR